MLNLFIILKTLQLKKKKKSAKFFFFILMQKKDVDKAP